MNKKEIFTIGYTSFKKEVFLEVLKFYEITCLIDVRTTPIASEFYKFYSKNELEPFLKENGIIYRNYSKEFGARQENKAFYNSCGCLDFEKFVKSNQFIDGVEKIEKGIQMGYKFVLMCAEKDPVNCHRSIMITRELSKIGFDVKHIMADKSIKSQRYIDTRLLEIYKIKPDFFKTEDEQILEAYQKRNKEIGFRGKDEEE